MSKSNNKKPKNINHDLFMKNNRETSLEMTRLWRAKSAVIKKAKNKSLPSP